MPIISGTDLTPDHKPPRLCDKCWKAQKLAKEYRCEKGRFVVSWINRGWKNSKKEPVANRDLWEPFIDLVQRRGDVSFRWVKGHAGDRLNDAADKLATTAAAEQRPRSGPRFTDRVTAGLEPDSVGAALGLDIVDANSLVAHQGGPLVVITGHRPTAFGGWDLANPVADGLRSAEHTSELHYH